MIEKDFNINYSLKAFLVAFGVCVAAVGVSYRFIDKPVVFLRMRMVLGNIFSCIGCGKSRMFSCPSCPLPWLTWVIG